MPRKITFFKITTLFLFSISFLVACEQQDTPRLFALTQHYFPTQGNAASKYGETLCLNQDFLMVAATQAKVSGVPTGTVYVYRNLDGAWKPVQTLYHPLYTANALFGSAIDCQDDLLVIGSYPSDEVYVFQLNTRNLWQFKQTITGPTGSLLGYSVSMDGDQLAVGAPDWTGTSAGQGAVFLFNKGTDGFYQQSATLSCPNTTLCSTAGAFLGSAIKMMNGRIVAGARSASAVAVFYQNAQSVWQSSIFRGSNYVATDNFGHHVNFDGSRIIASASQATVNTIPTAGAISIFDETSPNSWSEIATISLDIPAIGDQFGARFVYTPTRLVATAHGKSTNKGAVYIYNNLGQDTWVLRQAFDFVNAPIAANVGWGLAYDGHRIFAGAPNDQVDATGVEGGLYLLQTDTIKDVILEGRAGTIPIMP